MSSPVSLNGIPQVPDVEDLYSYYRNELAPSFALVEKLAVADGIPIQFYLEIRAAVTHLGRVYQMKETNCASASSNEVKRIDKEIADNLLKAKRHLRRFHLDCQKWCCVYFEEATANKLAALTDSCTLRLVSDGEYLAEARRLEQIAADKYREAKLEDSEGTDYVLEKYIYAVEAYDALYDHLYDPPEEVAKRIEELKAERLANTRRAIGWTAIGSVVTLIGFICNFL